MNRVQAAMVGLIAATVGNGGAVEEDVKPKPKFIGGGGFSHPRDTAWPRHDSGARARKRRFKLRGQKRAKARKP